MEERDISLRMIPDPGQRHSHRIGTLIGRRRIAAGLTQRQLADAAGVSLGALRDLEQCRTHSPRWQIIEKLGVTLGFEQSQIIDLRHDVDGYVRIDVLGPLTARLGAAQMELGSVRQRAVLGLLALHSGTCLHRDAFVDVLWGERPPASAVTELQGYISRLRKLLRTECLITTAGMSYRLAADQDQLDAAAFAQCARNAQRAAADGNPELACRFYERALSLWRGDVLADIDLLRQHPAVTALSCRRSDAVLSYAAAAQIARAHEEVLPHLRDLCARERFNEQAYARLMISLAATGQQAAALQIFTEIRNRLDGELGIRPSGLLAETHTRVLRQQTRLPAVGNVDCFWIPATEVDVAVGHVTDKSEWALHSAQAFFVDDVIPVRVGQPGPRVVTRYFHLIHMTAHVHEVLGAVAGVEIHGSPEYGHGHVAQVHIRRGDMTQVDALRGC